MSLKHKQTNKTFWYCIANSNTAERGPSVHPENFILKLLLSQANNSLGYPIIQNWFSFKNSHELFLLLRHLSQVLPRPSWYMILFQNHSLQISNILKIFLPLAVLGYLAITLIILFTFRYLYLKLLSGESKRLFNTMYGRTQ